MSNLYISFFGDGPLWDNTVLISAYPQEISYFRPFRYRDSWIQDTLLKKIKTAEGRKTLNDNPVIICMRFIDPNFKWLLLPIRKAKLTFIDYSPDNNSIYFRLGSYFNFTGIQELKSACLEIPPAEQSFVSNSLFFESNIQFSDSSFYSQENNEGIWAKYCDFIARDYSLPINKDARNALFLHFEVPENKKTAPINSIYSSHNRGSVFGPVLSEGDVYDLIISHRVPALISNNVSIKPVTIDFNCPTSNLEISPSSEELTGNYQKHIITISAKKPTGAWEEIIVGPQKEAEAQDGSKINTVKLPIPLKIKISLWYRIKTVYIWLIILWIALFITVVFDKLLGIDANKSNIYLILGIALTTLLSSIAIFVLQQRNVSVK
ncbi:MAG TPA: hypothetical protein VKF38_02120 [Anaerolineaceae bacterium]|nr:hypothetical protein [Anaerolineaceae bacterium]